MNEIGVQPSFDPARVTTPLARWLLDAANTAIREADAALGAYRFDEYAQACYRFVWNNFCDWFIEFAKPVLYGEDGAEKDEIKGVAQHVLGVILRLLHPVMPFITEELWDQFGYGAPGSLIRAAWPVPMAVPEAEAARAELGWVVALISDLRAVRAEMNVPPSITAPLLLQGASAETMARAGRWLEAIRRLGRVSELSALDGPVPKGVAQIVVGEATAMLPLAGIIDFAAERARLAKQRAQLQSDAGKAEAKLGNADFIARAKEEVVEENRERLATARAEILRLDAALARLAG